MGIDNFYLREMAQFIPQQVSTPRHVTCLGYPDLLVNISLIQELFGDSVAQNLPIDSRQNQIRSWHGFHGEVYDSIEMLSRMGYAVSVLDKIPHRGIEVLVDLNENLPKELFGLADLVLDTGTLEHCFNVGTAFRNMCDLVGMGGIVMTAAPANKLGHGYYNFCDNVYRDAFGKNGFEIMSLKLLDRNYNAINPLPSKKVGPPPKSIWLCVARRTELRSWQWPVQGKYL